MPRRQPVKAVRGMSGALKRLRDPNLAPSGTSYVLHLALLQNPPVARSWGASSEVARSPIRTCRSIVRAGAPRARTGPARILLRPSCIRVYTPAMEIMKIRRVGNSNVVSIPRSVAGDDFPPGTQVLVSRNDQGEITITPADRVREQVLESGRRIARERSEALAILGGQIPADAK